MVVGGPGVPTLPAAGLVVVVQRQNLDSAIILPHQTEGSGVQDHLLKDQTVTNKIVPDMENGDPGEVGPPAPRLAETERRQEQDSVTTHAQPMEEIGVLDLLLKLQDAKSHDASVCLPYSILIGCTDRNHRNLCRLSKQDTNVFRCEASQFVGVSSVRP